MYVNGYLSTGKYAIIAVDEEIYDPDVAPEWYMVKGRRLGMWGRRRARLHYSLACMIDYFKYEADMLC